MTGQESGLPRRRAVDPAKAGLDRGTVSATCLAALVPELDLASVGRDALDRVVERVQEHPATELAVGDDIEADVDLTLDDVLDRSVRDVPEVNGVGARVDRRHELRRPEQAADDLGTSGRPGGHCGDATS